MPRFIIMLALLTGTLAVAQPAVAMPVDGVYSHAAAVTPPATVDPPPPAVDPPPAAAGCPSRPTSADPNADCPLDLSVGYWAGDGDAPLAYHCNYDSGYAPDPCPHARVGDVPWYFKCVDSGLVGEEVGAAETDPVAQADVADNCGGDWYSLSVPADPQPGPPPPPDPGPCPSRPTGHPNPSCPLAPDGSGDHCDYYTGIPGDPCPHADADYIIVRCVDGPDAGDVLHIVRDTPLADVCDGGTPDVLDG